jgi:hypothetical protein
MRKELHEEVSRIFGESSTLGLALATNNVPLRFVAETGRGISLDLNAQPGLANGSLRQTFI